MGGLLDTLGIGYSGIVASRAGVDATAHNITNADTEGFHRRTLSLSPIDPPPLLGGGVSATGVVRVEDLLLGAQVESSLAQKGFAEARGSAMGRVEQVSADLGKDGLGAAISRLFAQFSELSTSPADPTVREQTLSAARQLAQSFNEISGQLQASADAVDDAVKREISGLNSALSTIAALNTKIVNAEVAGQNAADLRDQQEVLVSKLAETLGTSSFRDDTGQTTVLLGGHTLVQQEHASRLEAVPDVALGGRSRINLVNGASSRVDMTGRLGGSIGGQLSVRDQTTATLSGRVDQLAFDLASAVNAQHQAGFGSDGSTGNALFTLSAGPSGAAASLAVNAGLSAAGLAASSDATQLPGNNQNALALSALASAPLAGGGSRSVIQEAADMVGWVGGQTRDAEDAADAAFGELSHLQSMKSSVEGVSIDEEMVRLVQYQRSYEASAKVLHVVNSLLDQLMGLR